MQVTLSAEMSRFVEQKVKEGVYPSASELVEDALRLLRNSETPEPIGGEELIRLIAEGQADADRGDLLDADEVFAELRERSARLR